MIVSPLPAAEHVVLYDVSWEAYEHLLEAVGDRRLRHSYDDGTLEIMSPLKRHDRVKSLLARLIEMAAYEWDIDIQGIGSTTKFIDVDISPAAFMDPTCRASTVMI